MAAIPAIIAATPSDVIADARLAGPIGAMIGDDGVVVITTGVGLGRCQKPNGLRGGEGAKTICGARGGLTHTTGGRTTGRQMPIGGLPIGRQGRG